MADSNIPFAGSQFGQLPQYVPNQDDNIDPALLDLRWESTEIDQSADAVFVDSGQALSLGTLFPPLNPHEYTATTQGHTLNPQAASFQPYLSSGSDWRAGNRFGCLDPEVSSYVPDHGSQLYRQRFSEHHVASVSPASTYQYGHLHTNGHNIPMRPNGPPPNYSSANTTFPPDVLQGSNRVHTPKNQSLLVPSAVSSPDVSSWNRATYNPGVARHPAPALPPTPTNSTRGGRRRSIAPSVSTTGYTCPIDGKEFPRRCDLNHHMRWHEDGEHVCPECGKTFVKPGDLPRHMKKHNKADRHLMCNIIGCKYSHVGFNREYSLKRHNLIKHPGNILTPSTTVSGPSSQRNTSTSMRS